MQDLVIGRLRREFPLTFGENMSEEITRLLEYVLRHQFDSLLPNMLRKQMFVELYLGLFPTLKASKGNELVAGLEKIAHDGTGVFFFGDAAYLKLANNVGREHGDWMLQLIADNIGTAGFSLCGRFREGDEFVAYHTSTEEGARASEAIRSELGKYEVSRGLPVAIDFGYAEHREVAETFLRLYREGWRPEAGRHAGQVFFDIALKIAEVRAGVRKVYSRALLLFFYYQGVSSGNTEMSIEEYEELKALLTRGGKFLEPEKDWLGKSEQQLEDWLRIAVLAFLSPPNDSTHFDRVVIDRAESIYYR
jgi:hypothetical protein